MHRKRSVRTGSTVVHSPEPVGNGELGLIPECSYCTRFLSDLCVYVLNSSYKCINKMKCLPW